jgi:hypothetical protein
MLAHADELLYYRAPTELANVAPEMRSAGFWISRHPYPDKLIMDPLEVEAFNARSRKDGLIEDLEQFPPLYDGERLKKELQEIRDDCVKRELFRTDSRPADSVFYDALIDETNTGAIEKSLPVRFAFITARADERLLPTDDPLYAKPGDVDFDELQNSGLEPGTPVAVIHTSKSGAWLFVHDEIASGWVHSGRVAVVSHDDFLAHIRRRDSVVVTVPRADVFADSELTKFMASVRMGTRLVIRNTVGRGVEVVWPERQPDGTARMQSAFIPRSDVSIGYLPFTPRVVLVQAFKMQGALYGWGDTNGDQDCSRFLQMVFATVGIDLPRNSGVQAKAGQALAEFDDDATAGDKLALIQARSVGALTLLRLKGHIMLYLGAVDNRPYAIHATWAYRDTTPEGDRPRVIGRVAVSDLSLGEGSSKGSLLERILSIRLIH